MHESGLLIFGGLDGVLGLALILVHFVSSCTLSMRLVSIKQACTGKPFAKWGSIIDILNEVDQDL